jgi:hypothetical protein
MGAIMGQRAEASGLRLTARDAAIVKAMLNRGDRQHDIAAWFGVNGGRIGEIAAGKTFSHVQPALSANMPPPGPYPSGKDTMVAIQALIAAKDAIDAAMSQLQSHA